MDLAGPVPISALTSSIGNAELAVLIEPDHSFIEFAKWLGLTNITFWRRFPDITKGLLR